MDKATLVDFGAWQITEEAIAKAQRPSEVEELRETVRQLAALVEYLQRG